MIIHEIITHLVTIPNPQPDFGGPGVGALQKVAGTVAALVFIAAVIGIFVSGGIIAIGAMGNNPRLKQGGIIGLISCLIAVAIIGSGVAIANWVLGLNII